MRQIILTLTLLAMSMASFCQDGPKPIRLFSDSSGYVMTSASNSFMWRKDGSGTIMRIRRDSVNIYTPLRLLSVDSTVNATGGFLYLDANSQKVKMTGVTPIAYRHTIFTPSAGGTVNLINGQYNIINPSGTIATLTVNLPSSPANNDVVYIKYTQSVTTVTYGNGTVVDGITSPATGALIVLTYDSGSSSWY